ncbi:MAG: hypothetical protein ACYTFQ_19115 [Planctomycetota bacterium]|jgi:hypothetical protein
MLLQMGIFGPRPTGNVPREGLLAPQAPPQTQSGGHKRNFLDRILGLYGSDPGTHIPDERRGEALSEGLWRGGMNIAMAGGRGHDSLTPAQVMAQGLGGMRGIGPKMAAEGRQNQIRSLIAQAEGDPIKMRAIMMELISAGDPESLKAAQIIQQYISSSAGAKGAEQFTLAPGARRYTPTGEEIAFNPKDGENDAFAGLEKIDLGDSIGYADETGQIVRSYRKQDANELRDDFDKQVEEYAMVAERLGTLESAAVNPSPAGDVAMVFAFMKLMDPTSVVRESEYATAANAAGVPDRIRRLYNNLVDGDQLADAQRADFTQRGRIIGRDRQLTMQPIIQHYTERAQRMGVDPRDVVTDPYTGFDFSSVAHVPYRGASVEGAENAPRPSDLDKRTEEERAIDEKYGLK